MPEPSLSCLPLEFKSQEVGQASASKGPNGSDKAKNGLMTPLLILFCLHLRSPGTLSRLAITLSGTWLLSACFPRCGPGGGPEANRYSVLRNGYQNSRSTFSGSI